MQTTAIPKTVLKHLDLISRRFLWGETDGNRHHHSVEWDKIFQPKHQGGLSLPNLFMSNQCLLAKAFWRLVREPAELSSSVLISKYGGWPTLLSGIRVGGASPFWRALEGVAPVFREGLRWRIGNGQQVSFWLDRWLDDQPLWDCCLSLPPLHSKDLTVAAYWRRPMEWDVELLQAYLPPHLLVSLMGVQVIDDRQASDTPYWSFTSTGIFSIHSLKQRISPAVPPPRYIPWQRVWQFKGPLRASFTLWACLHKALPTAATLWRHHILVSPLCTWCGCEEQSIVHLLRDCGVAHAV